MKDGSEIPEPAVEQISDELADEWERMTRESDTNVGAVRVSMRWLRPQVEVIKRAAAQLGIPYQTYVKQAAFRQALRDLKAAEVAGGLVRGGKP